MTIILKNLNEDILIEICENIDIDSLFSFSLVNKKYYSSFKNYIKFKYKELIVTLKNKKGRFFIRHNDVHDLNLLDLPNDFKFLLKLLIIFNNNSNRSNYSTWYNNDRFDELSHPPNKSTSNKNVSILWYNQSRYKLKNIKNNNTYLNLLNLYRGLGHDFSLFNVKGTNKYFLDYQGGSHGYDYDDNIDRIINTEESKLYFVTLDEAMKIILSDKKFDFFSHS